MSRTMAHTSDVRLRGFLFIFGILFMIYILSSCSGEGTPVTPGSQPSLCTYGKEFNPQYSFVSSGSYVQDRNYYLLTLFQHLPEIRDSLNKDPGLQILSEQQENKFRNASATCATDTDCYANALLFSTGEAAQTVDLLAALYATGQTACLLTQSNMRESGMFELFDSLPDAEMVKSAWMLTLEGLTIVLQDYGTTLDPSVFASLVQMADQAHPEPLLFFEPLLFVSMGVLDERGMDNAGRFEPLKTGENRAAYQRMANVVWDDYAYPAILVPGHGPTSDTEPISPGSMKRCRLAVERLEQGLAPFLVVSGGFVHPENTPYCEAIEMKKYLMNDLGISGDVILVDPFARHTTTNLRNFARILFRYEFPTDRRSLVVTDIFQSFYIAFLIEERCLRELGYLPYDTLDWVSLTETSITPNIVSLQADPRDPRDP